MSEFDDVDRIANGLKQAPESYVYEGKLAEFRMVPAPQGEGRAAVYFAVWKKGEDRPLLVTLFPAGEWNEALLQDTIGSLKRVVASKNEETLTRRVAEAGRKVRNLINSRNAHNN